MRLAPAQAVRRARLPPPAGRAVLSMVTGRPACRFDGVTVFADTGEALGDVGVSGGPLDLIALIAGGLASSGLGLWMGLGRVRRAFGRMRARLRPTRRSLTA